MEPTPSEMTDDEIIEHLWRKGMIYFNSKDDGILRELIQRYKRCQRYLPTNPTTTSRSS